jgi:hypothetical protein
MLRSNKVSQTTPRTAQPAQWAMSSTHFQANWQVTATLLMDDLDNELEYNSTLEAATPRPALPAMPSFFAMLEAEGFSAEEIAIA